MRLDELLKQTVENGASDLHLTSGIQPVMRKDGKLVRLGDDIISPSDTDAFVHEILDEERYLEFEKSGDVDLSFSRAGIGRFRVNVFKQRGSCAIAIRQVITSVPKLCDLGLPGIVGDIIRRTKGLILVTGPTGSGKSTTLSAMIDQINEERECHVLTLEDPIEFLHKHKKSLINQREIGHDSTSYAAALRAAMREDPDVILVGEMRDMETISTAVTAAETGHLVLSTLHTVGAVNTIDRIIDVFPPHQQQQIRIQISMVLQGVISQQLLSRVDKKGRVAAIEVMVATPAIRNLIRESKTHQLTAAIQTGVKYGMQAMDNNLVSLYRKGAISYDDAVAHSMDPENIVRFLGSTI